MGSKVQGSEVVGAYHKPESPWGTSSDWSRRLWVEAPSWLPGYFRDAYLPENISLVSPDCDS